MMRALTGSGVLFVRIILKRQADCTNYIEIAGRIFLNGLKGKYQNFISNGLDREKKWHTKNRKNF